MAPPRQQRPPRRQAAPSQRRASVSSYGAITILARDRCGTLCLLCRIPVIFAPAPAILGDSSARLSFRTTLHGRGGGGRGEGLGGGRIWPKGLVFCEERSIFEALHSARVSHIILARIVAGSKTQFPPQSATTPLLVLQQVTRSYDEFKLLTSTSHLQM